MKSECLQSEECHQNECDVLVIGADDYNITPNQRMESEAKRSVTGVLYQTTVEHTATKIEFNTPNMTNTDMNAMMTLFRNNWTNSLERKLNLQYYDMETDSYKTMNCYMPDIEWKIRNIDNGNPYNINYSETRIAFIEK